MNRSSEREIAFKRIYSKFFNAEIDDEEINNQQLELTSKIIKSFEENLPEINETISTHLKGYTIERLFLRSQSLSRHLPRLRELLL